MKLKRKYVNIFITSVYSSNLTLAAQLMKTKNHKKLRPVVAYSIQPNMCQLQVTIATDLGKVVTMLQLERGEVALYIYTNGSEKSNLTQRFASTDEAINKMATWTEITVPASPNGTEDEGEIMLNKTSFQARLAEFRSQINSEENSVLKVTSLTEKYFLTEKCF